VARQLVVGAHVGVRRPRSAGRDRRLIGGSRRASRKDGR
jgi:hypothetical protein